MTLPNQLSVLRILLSPLFLWFFLQENNTLKLIGLIIYLIASITDWYDGWHARRFQVITKTGIFLDPLADKILTSCAFISFYILGIMPFWMMAIIVTRDIIVTFLRSYKEHKGAVLSTSYIAKVKTTVQMFYIFFILILMFLNTMDVEREFINYFLFSDVNYILMLIVTGLTLFTGLQYFIERKK
ncbi:MAG TPA: CDP-diacylglycerol--glycerol-3-phosphate 3-phosphatidyltransferase [Ignavibacteria bacterium]|nr:CDP-diacylglycerol--glycerol-3-phosphate 3-phosphatidyltransferase [Ignavibacteria bacterium]